ncbi:MAG: TetR/AcrR family transcriptional regulator [Gammaproteobacteria bacterium]
MPRGRAANFELQRQTILHRAAELFASRGYTGASMHELAGALGISKALLYHYCTEKYALLLEIAEGHIDRLCAVTAGETSLDALIRRVVDEYAEARFHHQVLVQDIKYLNDEDRARVLAKERLVVQRFADALAATEPGVHRASLEKPLTMLLFGMLNWLFTWFRADGRMGYAEMAELVTRFVGGGLRAVAGATGDGSG